MGIRWSSFALLGLFAVRSSLALAARRPDAAARGSRARRFSAPIRASPTWSRARHRPGGDTSSGRPRERRWRATAARATARSTDHSRRPPWRCRRSTRRPTTTSCRRSQRFVPQVTVVVTVPAGAVSDNLDTVVAELWSTGAMAKKISSTALTLTSKLGELSPGAPATSTPRRRRSERPRQRRSTSCT